MKKVLCLLLALVAFAATASAETFELDGLRWDADTESVMMWLGEGAVAQDYTDVGFYIVESKDVMRLHCSRVAVCCAENAIKTILLCFFEGDADPEALAAVLVDTYGEPDGSDALPYSMNDLIAIAGGVQDTRLCAWTTKEGISVDLYERSPEVSEAGERSYRYIVAFSSDKDLMEMVGGMEGAAE